jgi:hypothetical protein
MTEHALHACSMKGLQLQDYSKAGREEECVGAAACFNMLECVTKHASHACGMKGLRLRNHRSLQAGYACLIRCEGNGCVLLLLCR